MCFEFITSFKQKRNLIVEFETVKCKPDTNLRAYIAYNNCPNPPSKYFINDYCFE